MKKKVSLTLCFSLVVCALMLTSCKKEIPEDAICCSHCDGKGWVWPGNRMHFLALIPSECPICDGTGYFYPITDWDDGYEGLNFKGENSDGYIPSSDVYLERTDTGNMVKFKSYTKGYNTYVKNGGFYIKINGIYRVKIGSHYYYGI